MKPICGKEIVSSKPRPKSAYDFFWFNVLFYGICVVSRLYTILCSRLFRCSFTTRAFVTVNLLIERFEMSVYYYFFAHQHKAAGVKTKQNNGCDDLFGVHCVAEGDRIPPLQSYGQALKQENCFSGVLGDDCGTSAAQ